MAKEKHFWTHQLPQFQIYFVVQKPGENEQLWATVLHYVSVNLLALVLLLFKFFISFLVRTIICLVLYAIFWCILGVLLRLVHSSTIQSSVRQSDGPDLTLAMNGTNATLCRYEIWTVGLPNGRLDRMVHSTPAAQHHLRILKHSFFYFGINLRVILSFKSV